MYAAGNPSFGAESITGSAREQKFTPSDSLVYVTISDHNPVTVSTRVEILRFSPESDTIALVKTIQSETHIPLEESQLLVNSVMEGRSEYIELSGSSQAENLAILLVDFGATVYVNGEIFSQKERQKRRH